MKMSDDDISNFPELARYVRRRIPDVLNVGVIVNNMKKFGSLSKSDLQHALVWGAGPTIVVKDLSNHQCGVASAYGCFVHARPDQIELDDDMANTFESDASGAGADPNAKGQKVYIIGATILHELCHWGNFRAGRNEPSEQGMAFERATYGRVIG